MTKKTTLKNMEAKKFERPSEYMRARRPELFSDTPTNLVPVLEKSFLEYHLETLTNRKQEQMFEEFCRRLSELEICPNLKPQTGPTGGGDSKVDSSTYPVAPVLAERCYWGSPNPPSVESWAFAFSCKKNWRPKVLEDVEKIAHLERKFSKVYFLSNQFIRDKTRSELEAKLTSDYGFEVHILDRSWIVNRVIEHGREEVAIKFLDIRNSRTEKPQLGPRDMSRQQDLDALTTKLHQPEVYQGNDYALIEDFKEAALLSRGLSKDRETIDGFFNRARTLARKGGFKGQIIRCGYDQAWTSFWWFNDHPAVEQIYSEIEEFILNTDDAEECELFINLWNLLYTSVADNHIRPEKAKLSDRKALLRRELERLAQDSHRPNNALHAETELFLLDLFEGIQEPSKVKAAFTGLTKCLKRSSGLGHYPVKNFIHTFTELGSVLGDLPGYDQLFDEICRISKIRFGEINEGKLLFQRGIQLIDQKDPKAALVCLGKARLRLWKEETIKQGIRSALAASDAYVSMGLYWAGRMEALLAAHTALRTPETRNEFPTEAALATNRLAWLELQLGRIAPFLAWHELSWLQVGYLQSLGFDVDGYIEDLDNQGAYLGCWILNQEEDILHKITGLRNCLEKLNLSTVRWALLFLLGELDTIKEELPEDLRQNAEKRDDYFRRWKELVRKDELPKYIMGDGPDFWRYETKIFGVHYVIKPRKALAPVLYAENLLGIIEAALSLAKWENLAFIVAGISLTIEEREDGASPPKIDLHVPGKHDHYEIVWNSDSLDWLQRTEHRKIFEHFMGFLLNLLLSITIDPFEDLKKELDLWAKEEVFSRALGISPTSRILIDLLGVERYELNYWFSTSAT